MTHDKHQELFDALLNSVCLDEAIARGEDNPNKVLRKRHHDEDQDPLAGSNKEKKRSSLGKNFEPSKDKVQTGSSSKGIIQSKPSKTGKYVTVEESVAEPVHEVAMDVEEPILDDVVNDADQPQDETDPKNDKSTWFKQPPDLKLLIQNGTKTKMLMMDQSRLDKITKADLVRPVYKLLKGTCKSNIELEYNMDQCYNALTDQLDWKNPEGDRLLIPF
ncbi:hypothetical protein Tco_0577628 [Tanacetum coccineum]